MFRQEQVQNPFQGEAVQPVEPREIGRKVKAFAVAVGNAIAAIVEPFRGPGNLELLDPKVRAGMTEQEKGIVNAYFHGV